jgi:hypothetical protein
MKRSFPPVGRLCARLRPVVYEIALGSPHSTLSRISTKETHGRGKLVSASAALYHQAFPPIQPAHTMAPADQGALLDESRSLSVSITQNASA